MVEAQNSLKKEHQTQQLLKTEWLDPQIVKEIGLPRAELAPIDGNLHLADCLLQANRTHKSLENWRATAREGQAPWLLKEGLLLYGLNWLVVPEDGDLQVQLLNEIHCQPSTAHPGRNKMRRLVAERYYWPNMTRDVDQYVANCHTCQQSQNPWDKPPGLLQPLPISEQLWRHISMDFQSFLKDKHGYDAALVVVDCLGKRPISIPCHKTTTAQDMARLFVLHVYWWTGPPDTIVSDCGPQFISDFWDEFCQILGIKLKLSTTDHPQTDGQTEIINQHIAQCLCPFVNHYQDDWSEWLPILDFAAAVLPHDSTGVSLFLLDCGVIPWTSFDWQHPQPADQSAMEQLNRTDTCRWVKRLEATWNFARKLIEKAQNSQQRQTDRHRRTADFEVGDSVWVSMKN